MPCCLQDLLPRATLALFLHLLRNIYVSTSDKPCSKLNPVMRATILTRGCPMASEVTDPRAARPGIDSARHLPSKKTLSRSKVSVKEPTDRSRLHVMSLSKCKTLLCMLGNSCTQVSKNSKQVAIVLPLKITRFYAENKIPYSPGRSSPTLSKRELCNMNPETSYLFRI